MLTLYIDELPNDLRDMKYCKDVENLFSETELKCSADEIELIKNIDKGHLISSNSFIDRFGYKRNTKELSTGCKAGLCVITHKDKIIDLVECNWNARDYIISNIRNGYVFVMDTDAKFGDLSMNGNISIRLDNYHFTSIYRLNFYIHNERFLLEEPDLLMKGIEKNEM